jgi:hypothetical protein
VSLTIRSEALMAGEWLRVDEYTDVLSSTDILALVGPRLRKSPSDWKWMILAAHNGVQGALVCAIQDSSSTNILSKQSAIEMLNWLETLQGDRPTEHLAEFSILVKRFRKKYPTALTAEQHRKIFKLHREFRNKFAHFTPTHWSIEISMLPVLLESAIDLIESAMQQDQVTMKTNGNFKSRLKRNLVAARAALASWENHGGGQSRRAD